jgi:hypothetical protein
MAHTACPVCLASTVNGRSMKKEENVLDEVALVVGTLQTLSNLIFNFDIYDCVFVERK